MPYDTKECGYDGGDCPELNYIYPECAVVEPSLIGNNICDEKKINEHNITERGYDGGDCWSMEDKGKFGNRFCDGGTYSTSSCHVDFGDCVLYNSLDDYTLTDFRIMCDGKCYGGIVTKIPVSMMWEIASNSSKNIQTAELKILSRLLMVTETRNAKERKKKLKAKG